jgi:hypothetical protein
MAGEPPIVYLLKTAGNEAKLQSVCEDAVQCQGRIVSTIPDFQINTACPLRATQIESNVRSDASEEFGLGSGTGSPRIPAAVLASETWRYDGVANEVRSVASFSGEAVTWPAAG